MGQGQGSGNLEDKYFLQKVKLGQGSFGTVWRAVDRHNDRVVAIKQLDKASLPRRGVKRADIEREIAMMKATTHENLTMLYDFFEDNSTISLALEYCDGGDFGDKVKERGKSMEEMECAEYVRQMCAAINALHSKQICHRDIKPDNFMVQGSNKLKLTDFGLAIFLPPGKLLTEKCGTPAFMAPEQHKLPKQSRGYGLPADVWAAGVSMFMVMFGGRHPFMSADGRQLDDKLLLQGQLDFRENSGQQFFGFDFGMGELKFSQEARELCQRMVTPDERQRLSAEDALKQQWLVRLGQGHARPSQHQEKPPLLPQGVGYAGDGGGYSNGTPLPPANMPGQRGSSGSREGNYQRQKTRMEDQLMMQQLNRVPSGPSQPPLAGALPNNIKCRYHSSSYDGWFPAMVLHWNDDGTYDLDVRPHATCDKIAPTANVTLAEAWPPGTYTWYHSSSVNKWMEARVQGFNESDGTYNLDVRDHADVDRIRVRLTNSGPPLQPPEGPAALGAGMSQQPEHWRPDRRDSKTSQEGRDGSAAAPLRIQDLAGGLPNATAAPAGGLQRSPQMTEDPHQRFPNRTGYDSSEVGAPVYLSAGMMCMLVDPDLGIARVEAVRDGAYDVFALHRNQRQAVRHDQLRAPPDLAHAWPAGTKVQYFSQSEGGRWINATVKGLEMQGKYNLDVKQNAPSDLICPREPRASW